MSVPFRVGYCVNCGKQAYARNFRGGLMGAFPGTKVCWIVLSNDAGRECRVGTIMFCKDCDITKVDIAEIKKTLASNPESGVTGNEPEWVDLPNARLELVKDFSPKEFRYA